MKIRTMTKKLTLAVVASATILSIGSNVRAQEETRVGPLVDAPAIRGRLELRQKRFELGAGLGSTIGQDFYHATLLNLKLGYHFTDWLALTAMVAQNVTPEFQTGTTDRLLASLPEMPSPNLDRSPSKQQAKDGMNHIGTVIGAQAEIAAITGKFSMFSEWFFNYDFYLLGGLGYVNLEKGSDAKACGVTASPSCPFTGFKPAVQFGGGMHAFINELVAVNIELRDVMLRNNPSGRDVNADKISDENDLTLDQNFIVTVNAQFFLPRDAKRSD
ncbi:MAG: outer membrane beta-barrel domain-containing protein [Deltaproteobacteria bacterium]|nr:outer membrane beta-barrel domain-containing protein [Deltaproteobacteria bacterium]